METGPQGRRNSQRPCRQKPTPRLSKGKSAEQKDKYSQKCARAGNLSEAAATLYKSSLPACSVDTVDKLRMLHPEGNLDYPKDARPSLQQEAEFWEAEEGRNLLGDTFSIRNVSAYLRKCPALAPDHTIRGA